jgi:hypothetical protein
MVANVVDALLLTITLSDEKVRKLWKLLVMITISADEINLQIFFEVFVGHIGQSA